ncbi:DegT/DnrJ/EryC1/StrS family aminotransferase [Limisalsivibrio acetivorans]|uniref:DegT/DnrJ/EryC1/StrS family aminotransferase n=1 Tax=Limisalsivibrio acetivorans TaxID=1304888 RepID=UPI0003B74B80|nr:DegT/DnrJ/EryC1/StrS family aminotransferase [Limisalsivibrio acetivorans]
MRQVKFLDLPGQYRKMKHEMDQKLHEIIDKGAFVGGAYPAEFEAAFAEYTMTKACVGTGNGTDALEAALWGMNLPEGSEVVIPANTFIATAEAVVRNGLKVVFCDCLEDYTISPESLESVITPNTSCVIPVHLYGQPAWMDKIMEIACKHGLKVLEDSAQSHGAEYNGERTGSMGDAGAFSFYPGKNLGAYGDGGAVVTKDEDMASRIRQYIDHGRTSKFYHDFQGRNSRLDGLQAGVLSVKLKYLDEWIGARNRIAGIYLDKLKGTDAVLPVVREGVRHVWHLFVIRHERRDVLREYLTEKGIQTGIHYPVALPKQPAFKADGCEDFFACRTDKELLSLPMGEHLTAEEAEYVADCIKSFGG